MEKCIIPIQECFDIKKVKASTGEKKIPIDVKNKQTKEPYKM